MSNHTSWHITHLKKKNFLKFFLGFFRSSWGFLTIFYVVLAQIQKINMFWKPQSLAYLKPLTFIWFVYFSWFCCNFEKKIMTTKILFQKFLFFRFLKITFSEHNSARFDEKCFLKISKKFFSKNNIFFKWVMSQLVWFDTN